MNATKILLIDDDESYANSFRLMMREHPVEIVWSPTGAQGIQAYQKNALGYATVVVDYLLPDLTGPDVAQHIHKINPSQDILFASGYSEPSYLTEMLVSGVARSFIVKGQSTQDSRETVLKSLSIFENRNRVLGADDHCPEKAQREAGRFGFIGRSRAMQELVKQIDRLRSMPVDVRIIGESGTGKELVAKALLPDGLRMVEVACPEFNSSEGAFESDLFGHVKGSFTGADSEKSGLILQAHKNVLFLDEVHTLSATNQEKFLRVLQERKFRRKGDEKGVLIPVTFRLFSAAKPSIHQMVRDGLFLEDLFYRLGRADIFILPLRDRPEDIEPLVRHYQDHYNRTILPQENQKQFRISTIREMEKYPWSANVRQLDTAVCNMMLKARGDIINPSDFDEYLKGIAAQSGVQASTPTARPMREVTDEVIREQIIKALKTSRTQIEASTKLGVDRCKLIRDLKRLGIDPKAYFFKPQTGGADNVT